MIFLGPRIGLACLASTIIAAIAGSVARGVAVGNAWEVVKAGVAEEFVAVDELVGGLAETRKRVARSATRSWLAR